MFKAIFHTSAGLLTLLSVLIYDPTLAIAQIAPTNTATISGSVSDSIGKPITHAKVTISGMKSASTQSDVHGLFVFVGMPFGTYQLTAQESRLGTVTRSLTVEADTNVAIVYNAAIVNGLKVIAQVGSTVSAQFNVTSASVTQVSPIANAFQGKTSWRTILEQIPGVAQAGLGSGGSNVFGAIPDSPFEPVQISINGALPYETAVLLDNMPLIGGGSVSTPGTGTDLSFYPLNGFDSADVVRGPGANAPSIVDSIGGSFVLHAPGMANGNHYDLSLSSDPYGGIVSNALVAVRWKKLSATVTYGINSSPGPLNNAGIPAYTLFNPSTIDGQSFVCSGSCAHVYPQDPNYVNGFDGFQSGLLLCCVNRTNAWNQHSGSIALAYTVSPSVSAEIFYAGQISQQSQYLPSEVVSFAPPAGYTGSLTAGQYILSPDNYTFQPCLYLASSSLLEEKIVAQLGHGVLKLAALQNRGWHTGSLTTPTSANLQIYGGGTLNGMPAIFNGGHYDVTFPSLGSISSGQTNNRDLLLSYATPLGENLHAGASFVRSYYNMPQSSNCTFDGFPGFSQAVPAGISQTTDELRLFIGGTPSSKTSLDLSGYFVNANYHIPNPSGFNFSTYTSTNGWIDSRYTYTAPRLGFVWRPTASVAIRAAAGGGFAEAPLGYLVGSNCIPQLNNMLGIYTVFTQNLNLQPEKSFGFDVGTDIQLHHDTVLSFDLFHTNLYGQFYNSTSLTGTYLGLPLYTTKEGNLGVSRYEGILLDVRHDVSHGLYWSLSSGLTRGYVVSVPPGFYDTATCTNCANLNVVPNINFNGEFVASIPYAQGLGTIGYRWNPRKYADLVATYYGNNNTYFRPAFVEFDGHIGYPLMKNASLSVTFRNITGIYGGTTQLLSADNQLGAPAVSGPPYAQFGEEYGPRTVLLTMNVGF